MADLSTTYMGLKMRNPIIAGSSGLMNDLTHLKQLEEAGAGAVVLKSVFEEQIRLEKESFIHSENENAQQWKSAFNGIVKKQSYYYEEALDYINDFAKEHTLKQYLSFVSAAKKHFHTSDCKHPLYIAIRLELFCQANTGSRCRCTGTECVCVTF